MKRSIQTSLVAWVKKENRKPLVLIGPRQVGKTWLMKQLGQEHFEQVIYLNFEREKSMTTIFEDDYDPQRILSALEVFSGKKIEMGQTLIILDEIQEAPGGLTALKYFQEELPDLHLIAAGSLLGVGSKTTTSFPVGKVELKHIHPMSFVEFLQAVGEEKLSQLISDKKMDLLSVFHDRVVALLKTYYFVGGMPEAVNTYTQTKTLQDVRDVQLQILEAYERDFSKHAPKEIIPRIRQVWNTFVAQLAKENKKFVYGLIRTGARAREYESAIEWLMNYGLVHAIYRTSAVHLPIKAYADTKHFKLFFHDVGLLAALAQLDARVILEGDKLFREFKGALTEQFVVQQLVGTGVGTPFYWTNDSGQAEVDFLFETQGVLHPLEVKAAENLQSKSLQVFHEKYTDVHCYRTSLSGYREEDWLTNIPLYAFPHWMMD